MDKRINPFNELYVTETVGSDQFVRLFSPSLIKNIEPLFLPGNIVLTGVKGSGKSMLLNLFIPEMRIAYIKSNENFPVPDELSNFIGAGISLIRNKAIDFGQRPLKDGLEETLPLYFGDYLNYFIVYDILKSIETFATEAEGKIARDLQLNTSTAKLDRFAKQIAQSSCWFAYLDSVKTFEQLKSSIINRLNSYHRFLNYNDDDLPIEIVQSKTSVGEPISETILALSEIGVVKKSTHFFIRIDQYEELANLEGKYKTLGPLYQTVVNKIVGLRDPNISYRIGTRLYGWNNNPLIYGTTAKLEEDRNYKKIDLDEVLRRKENVGNWVYENFAEDVFRRRLNMTEYITAKSDENLAVVFGRDASPITKAKYYAGKSPKRAIQPEANWPDSWIKFLEDLAIEDPLSARLAEAWCRQQGKQDVMYSIPKSPYPWDKTYWRKERVEAALMQIAGRCTQRMIWFGKNDVLQLSNGNILIFVSLCQHIWAAWLRTIRNPELLTDALPQIDMLVQAVGVLEASNHWYEKIIDDSGGEKRQRFLIRMATTLSREMFRDYALSYPGNNGFSIKNDDLNPVIEDYLRDNVNYGVFVSMPHTTKTSDRMPRTKWYPSPIYCPYFRLPHVHTKEPKYMKSSDLEKLIENIKADNSVIDKSKSNPKSKSDLNQNKLQQSINFGTE